MSEGVNDIVHAADNCIITSFGVGLCQEDVAVWLVVVGDCMSGAGDGGDEVTVRNVVIVEG